MANLGPLIRNGVYSTVQAGSSAIGSSSATGVNVATGDGAKFGTIGTNQFIPAVIVDTSTSPETIKEYVWVTAISTDALTVVRQAEDSSTYAASTTSIQAGYTIAAVASLDGLSAAFATRPMFFPRDHGYLSWTCDIPLANGNFALANGTLYVCRVPLPPRSIAVNSISIYITTAGATLTSNQNFAGIYSSAGTKLAATADQSTAWLSTGVISMALASAPVTLTVGGPDEFVWVALLSNGTTRPTLRGTGFTFADLANANLAAAKTRYGTAATSQTSLPASITPGSISTGSTTEPWVAIA